MSYLDRISTDPNICHGKPCVKGTRVLVSVVLANLAAGNSDDDILRSYPTITAADVRAVIQFAADMAKDDLIYLTPPTARAS